MNSKKLFNFFQSHFDLRQSSNGWYRLDNPFNAKKDKSMGVNFTYNRVICHRTHFKSSILDFLRIYTQKDSKDIYQLIEKYTEADFKMSVQLRTDYTQIKLPEGFYLLNEEVALQDRAIQYLESRNYDIQYCMDNSIGFCNKGDFFGRIIIPYMNPILQYYVGRDFIGTKPKYKFPKKEDVGIGKSEIFYNEQALRTGKVYLVEGPFDSLRCGPHGLASSGWDLSKYQLSKLIKSGCEVFMIPDSGFYKKALITASKLIPNLSVNIVNLDSYPDGTDVDDIGLDNLIFEKVTWQKVTECL